MCVGWDREQWAERRVRKKAVVLLSVLVLCGWSVLWVLQTIPLLVNSQPASEACWFLRLLLAPEPHQRGTHILSALPKLRDTVLLPHQGQKPSK